MSSFFYFFVAVKVTIHRYEIGHGKKNVLNEDALHRL